MIHAPCFHPLKAGRRLPHFRHLRPLIIVSIPSRRVGDLYDDPDGDAILLVSIPSRRVGDSYLAAQRAWELGVSIPSRRVGDPCRSKNPTHRRSVSIPSRRVGDGKPTEGTVLCQECSFHPLKAGRRHLRHIPSSLTTKVSIPSRRVGDCISLPGAKNPPHGFHPLKAGRRRC